MLNEPTADACTSALATADGLLISASTVAEALIVAGRRDLADLLGQLIDGLGFEIVDVTPASARRVVQIYERWGKGLHPAALNFGDCFAYDVAKAHGCPLLCVGEGFAKTDILSAL